MTATQAHPTSPAPQWFADLFAHRRWIQRVEPFPHVYARDVFAPEFYRKLTDELARVRHDRPEAFQPVADGYGASGMPLTDVRDSPFAVFLSREWHDLIAKVTGVAATGDVDAAIHHHPPGSPSGWPHNDLNPAWFAGPAPGPGTVRLADATVDLKTGAAASGASARETVRAVGLLFYLGNPDWRPGSGGETALYDNLAGNPPTPALTIPPLDNSMVLFECTPRSWHTFVGKNAAARNCVVMWLHRPKSEVADQWGGENIEHW